MLYQVLPYLWISDYPSAKKAPYDWYIINATKDLPMLSTFGTRLPVNDDRQPESIQTMKIYLPRIIEDIDSKRSAGINVLVHCRAGQQRSAAIIAAYLMKTKHMSADDAITYVKSKKPDAFLTGVNFYDSFSNYYSY
jgi:Dual specificity phosphatase, catalytic domain